MKLEMERDWEGRPLTTTLALMLAISSQGQDQAGV